MGWFTVFRSRRMAVLFLLGFSSGCKAVKLREPGLPEIHLASCGRGSRPARPA